MQEIEISCSKKCNNKLTSKAITINKIELNMHEEANSVLTTSLPIAQYAHQGNGINDICFQSLSN
jgi:hypothetical protein